MKYICSGYSKSYLSILQQHSKMLTLLSIFTSFVLVGHVLVLLKILRITLLCVCRLCVKYVVNSSGDRGTFPCDFGV